MDKSPQFVLEQYKLLYDRNWRLNDLLWKNLLAYGAAFGGITSFLKEFGGFGGAKMYIAIGGHILFLLAIFQLSLVRSLAMSVHRLIRHEHKHKYDEISFPPTWDTIYGAHALIALAMLVTSLSMVYCLGNNNGYINIVLIMLIYCLLALPFVWNVVRCVKKREQILKG